MTALVFLSIFFATVTAQTWELTCEVAGFVCENIAQSSLFALYVQGGYLDGSLQKMFDGDTVTAVNLDDLLKCVSNNTVIECVGAFCAWVPFQVQENIEAFGAGICVPEGAGTTANLLGIDDPVGNPMRLFHPHITQFPTGKEQADCYIQSSNEMPTTINGACNCCEIPNIYGIRSEKINGNQQSFFFCGPSSLLTGDKSQYDWCELLNIDNIQDVLNPANIRPKVVRTDDNLTLDANNSTDGNGNVFTTAASNAISTFFFLSNSIAVLFFIKIFI